MVRFRTEVQILFPRLGDFGCTLRIVGNWRFAEYFGCGNTWCLSSGNDLAAPGNTQQCKPASNLTHVSVDVDSQGVQSPISVGPACRAGLRGHAATSDESRSKEASRGDVERMCVPRRFALRRKSFPAERTYFNNHPRLHPSQANSAASQQSHPYVCRNAGKMDRILLRECQWTANARRAEETRMARLWPQRGNKGEETQAGGNKGVRNRLAEIQWKRFLTPFVIF